MPEGGWLQFSGGVWLVPSQVYWVGIGWPFWKAELVSAMVAGCFVAPQLVRAMAKIRGASARMVITQVYDNVA